MMLARRKRSTDDVRIGPISVLTLIAILCMAVLAVLAVSTASASLAISQKQATSTTGTYLAEVAAQDFVAEAEALSAGKSVSGADAAKAVQSSMSKLVEHAEEASDGLVTVRAEIDGLKVAADFSSAGGRTLSVAATVQDGGSLHVDEWRVTAVQNVEQPAGGLWAGA